MMSDWAGKTVFITGATGFLGGAMARELAAQGAHVKALARRPGRDRYLQGISGIEMVSGDLGDTARLTELIRKLKSALGNLKTVDAQRLKITFDGDARDDVDDRVKEYIAALIGYAEAVPGS